VKRIARTQALLALGVVIGACGLGLLIYITGAVDYIPKVRASAMSPDGHLVVTVYERRITPRPIFPSMGAYVRVTDRNGKRLFQDWVYEDDDWDDTVGYSYNEIKFDGDEIRIGPDPYNPNKVFTIRRSDLPE
jgi:hypothetical protein